MKQTVRRVTALLLCLILCLASAAASGTTLTVRAPEGGSGLTRLTGLVISGVDAPETGKALDAAADVSSAEGIAWEIPVIWLKGFKQVKGALSSEDSGAETVAREGVTYVPALVFFVPEGYTFDGTVTLDGAVSALLDALGKIVTVEMPESGVTYITCAKRTAATNYRPEQPDEPEEPEEPEKSPYELFAEAYAQDHNVDIEAVFESFGGLENTDWDAFVRAFSYRDAFNEMAYVVSDFNTQLLEYLDDDWGAWGTDYQAPIVSAVERYKADLMAQVPEEVRAHGDESTCLFVDTEGLTDLIDTLKNVVQPQAINVLRERMPVIANAMENEMSSKTGLKIIYNNKNTYAATDTLRDGDELETRIQVSTAAFYDGTENDVDLISFGDKLDLLADIILHEDIHLFMYDYNRNGMAVDISDLEHDYDIDYDTWTVVEYYSIAGTDIVMSPDEYVAWLDSMTFPQWVQEGTAMLVTGFYHKNYCEEMFARAGTEEDGRLVFTADTVKTQYNDEIGALDVKGGIAERDAQYCYGPLAMMYLAEKQLQANGKTALVRDRNGNLVSVDNAALRDGLSEMLTQMHSEHTLEEVVEGILGEGNGTDTFAKQFIKSNDESLDFCVDVLNYLQAESDERGYTVSGGILYEDEEMPKDVIDWENDTVKSDFYQFSDSEDWVLSDVSPEIAGATKTRDTFDLDEYRRENGDPATPTDLQ